MLELGINYSPQAERLLRAGRIRCHRFKCPAWMDLVERLDTEYPLYVHFSLQAGGDQVRDSETGAPADWDRVEALLARTRTPLVNLHPLEASPGEEEATGRLVRQVEMAVRRFGAERVALENGCDPGEEARPQVLARAVGETGCGLVLDLAHARLAAGALGLPVRAYVEALPVDRLRELHVTGVQRVDARWVEWGRARGVDEGLLEKLRGKWQDHLPMTGVDWDLCAWALEQVAEGVWSHPWIATLEYGGVGKVLEAITEEEALVAQMARLARLVGYPGADKSLDFA